MTLLPPLTALSATPPQVLDSSQIVCFRSCPRKFLYTYCNHLRSHTGKSLPLIFGGAFASGLEHYRTARLVKTLAHKPALELAYCRAITSWGDNPSEMREKDPRTLPRCLQALDWYTKTYPIETDSLQPHTHSVSTCELGVTFEFNALVELSPSLGFPLHPSGSPYLYSVRFDTLGTYMGLSVFADEKTTTQVRADWPQQWTFRHQFAGYAWALQQLGYPHRSAVVRGVVIHKNDFVALETPPILYSPHTLQKFEEDLRHTVREIDFAVTGVQINPIDPLPDHFPRAWGDACSAYNTPCAFTHVCFGHPRDELDLLAQFPREVWNPAERK